MFNSVDSSTRRRTRRQKDRTVEMRSRVAVLGFFQGGPKRDRRKRREGGREQMPLREGTARRTQE